MFAEGFKKEKLLIVGLQECRSKDGGALQIGDYHRRIPDVKGQAAGDVELWFNTIIPWDATDPATTLKPTDAQIVATGPKFMIAHLGNEWIDLDVIVAHAPHSWEIQHEEGAEQVAYAFWEQLQLALTKGAKPHALFFWKMPIWNSRTPRRATKALGSTSQQKRLPTTQASFVNSWRRTIWHCHVRTKDVTKAEDILSTPT